MSLQAIISQHHAAVGRGTFWDARTWQAMRAIVRCRTAACGSHARVCNACGTVAIAYNSCRDRNCPLCQGRERAAWVAKREADVLDVPYFHVVCTLPHDLLDLVRWAPATSYGILHTAARRTIDGLLRDPRHGGIQPGMIAVLHTWASDLTLHPHIHLIIPAGGIDHATGAWRDCRYNRKRKRPFLVPIDRLRARFTATVLGLVRDQYDAGDFHREGEMRGYQPPTYLDHGVGLRQLLARSRRRPWVVYIKRPFADPRRLIRYLGRYTHRTAIDPRRVTAYDGERVTFQVRDRTSGAMRPHTLAAQGFVRRFAQHILPRGFHRIRHTGFMANACRRRHLTRIRAQLASRCPAVDHGDTPAHEARSGNGSGSGTAGIAAPAAASHARICPLCGGPMVLISLTQPDAHTANASPPPPPSRRETSPHALSTA